MRAAPADSSIQDLLEGTPFQAVRCLGAGSMGQVVEAEHVKLGKRVVVKLLHDHLVHDLRVVDRLRLEAQALARLSPHPNLPQVLDIGVTGQGRPYLVMELLHGRTLRAELIDRGTIAAPEAIDWILQALAPLALAHRVGLVHRDVKLDNLFLCDASGSSPRVLKVLDFGIAKVVGATEGGAPAPLVIPTEEETPIGTPHYYSPEQAKGLPVDSRTDIYAMGCCLYTLIAGRRPFQEMTTELDLARAHAMQHPPRPSVVAPLAVRASIPEALDQVILHAMAKRPEDRFPSAESFMEALRTIETRPIVSGVREITDDTTEPEGATVQLAIPRELSTGDLRLDNEAVHELMVMGGIPCDSPTDLQPMVIRLSHPHPAVRALSAVRIAARGDVHALPSLRAMILRERHSIVRDRMKAAVAAIEARTITAPESIHKTIPIPLANVKARLARELPPPPPAPSPLPPPPPRPEPVATPKRASSHAWLAALLAGVALGVAGTLTANLLIRRNDETPRSRVIDYDAPSDSTNPIPEPSHE